MPTSPEVEAISKHARALERLRHTRETILDLLEELPEKGKPGGAGQTAALTVKLERLAVKLGEAVEDLE
tara:strand:+ start:1760 stop:1966 length:207 start_codon:yes stop_codon:yes gene_type:complete